MSKFTPFLSISPQKASNHQKFGEKYPLRHRSRNTYRLRQSRFTRWRTGPERFEMGGSDEKAVSSKRIDPCLCLRFRIRQQTLLSGTPNRKYEQKSGDRKAE